MSNAKKRRLSKGRPVISMSSKVQSDGEAERKFMGAGPRKTIGVRQYAHEQWRKIKSEDPVARGLTDSDFCVLLLETYAHAPKTWIPPDSDSSQDESNDADKPKLEACVELARDSVAKGNLIAVPTDTIYGICCSVQCENAVEKLYKVKGRRKDKPIAICVGSIDDVKRWGKVTVSDTILEALLPGPVTLVFERAPELNPSFNSFTNLIGIRIPDHCFMQELAKCCGEPLALTSANKSDTKSSLKVDEFSNIWDKLDVIFDGGQLGTTEESRAGSTVIDLSTSGSFSIIRKGSWYDSVVSILRDTHGLVLKDDEKP